MSSYRRLPEDIPVALAKLRYEDLRTTAQHLSENSADFRYAISISKDFDEDIYLIQDILIHLTPEVDNEKPMVDSIRDRVRRQVAARDHLNLTDLGSRLLRGEHLRSLRRLAYKNSRDSSFDILSDRGLRMAATEFQLDKFAAGERSEVEAAERRLAEYAREDIASFAVERLEMSGAAGFAYLTYLSIWWWRFVLVAWAISDEIQSDSDVQRTSLNVDSSNISARSLEPFIEATQSSVDADESPFGPEDESFIRAELDILRSQHRVIEGADVWYIRRAISRIVTRMADRQKLGRDAHQLLSNMAPDAPEIVREIEDGFADFVTVIAEEWQRVGVDPAIEESANPITKAAEISDRVEAAGKRLPDRVLREILRGVPQGIGSAVGSSTLGLAGSIAVGLASSPAALDASVFWLLEAAPSLADVYTFSRAYAGRAFEE